MEKINWKKVGLLFIAFALANLIYDYWSQGIVDIYKTIGIPLIAIVMIYLVDRKRLENKEK